MAFFVIARPSGRSNLKLSAILDCFASLAVTLMQLFRERLQIIYDLLFKPLGLQLSIEML